MPDDRPIADSDVPVTSYAAGWYADPVGAHDLRYHNGSSWTGDVSTDGVRYVAPLRPFGGTGRSTPPPVSPPPERPPPSGTAALVLGIVSMCLGWIPFVAVVASGLAVAAIVVGTRRRRWESARGAADVGIVTGIVGLLFAVGGIWLSVALIDAVASFDDPGPHDAVVTSCAEVDGVTRITGTITNRDDRTHTYTVEVTFDGDSRTDTEVADVAAGATTEFTIDEDLRFDELDCAITAVHGPRPFGIDTTN